MNRQFSCTFLILSLIFAPAAVLAESGPPEVSLEGLELIGNYGRGEFLVDPRINWSVYTELQLDSATVAFRRNWQRDQNQFERFKVRASDMERIKKDLSQWFDEVFTEELTTNGGYKIVGESGDHVMRIEPHIVDLDVNAPDTRTTGFTRSYADTAGRMTLNLHIYDSVTGDLIAMASDRQVATQHGYARLTNNVTNNAEARLMFKRSAKALRERLDEARSH